ncbi:helix-turn-helix transcriptional regulator [Aeromonas veronii]
MDDLSLSAAELKDIRARLEWSQQRMADELAVARNTVVRMENGQMAIERRTALAVRYLAWHHAMIEKVTKVRRTGHAALISMELGDAEKQVALPLPEPKQELPDPDLSPAQQAWAVYMPLLTQYKGYADFKKRFLKFSDFDGGYSYLFMLQLLERLANMAQDPQHVPYEWTSTNALREYARKLYKANPQWH